MAVMPGVSYQPVAGLTSRITRHDIVCIHTIVGNDPAPAAHFSTRGDGHVTQNRDTVFRSAANLNGNHRVIAIENDDHGPEFGVWSGSNVPAFTAVQCESIARICAWAYHTHGIPLVLCPDSRPGSRGIAFHRQGCDGNFGSFAYGGRVPGGELWSSSFGKVCPGDRRISQLIDVIIPLARRIAGLDAPLPQPLDNTEEELEALVILPATRKPLDANGVPTQPVYRQTNIPRPFIQQDMRMILGMGWGGRITGKVYAWAVGGERMSKTDTGYWPIDIASDKPAYFLVPAGAATLAVEYDAPHDVSVTWGPNKD